jgi:hypothetical protein
MCLSLRKMELALIGNGVQGGIKKHQPIKGTNFKKAMRSPDADEWLKIIKKEKAQCDKNNTQLLYCGV